MHEVQEKVKAFAKEHNMQNDPQWHALNIVSDMGGLSKEILKSTDHGRRDPAHNPRIDKEIGHVFFNLLMLANEYEVDITHEIEKTLKNYNKKKYLHGRLSTSLS